MQCFDTFRRFLHKLYAAAMDGKGRKGTYNFSHDDWGQPGAGHRAQGAAAFPCHPAGAAHEFTFCYCKFEILEIPNCLHCWNLIFANFGKEEETEIERVFISHRFRARYWLVVISFFLSSVGSNFVSCVIQYQLDANFGRSFSRSVSLPFSTISDFSFR